MDQIKELVTPFITKGEGILNRTLDNIYINTSLKVFLALYAALAAPKLPPSLLGLFDNIFVRIGIAFLIVFVSMRDSGMALMIALAFIITLQTINKLRLYNSDLSVATTGELSWLPSAKPNLEKSVEAPEE